VDTIDNLSSAGKFAETPARYTATAVVLHWLIAVLIVTNIVLGLSAEQVPDEWVRTVVDLHKSIGITVLGLVGLRIIWRISHQPPTLPANYAPVEVFAAKTAHLALYVLIIAIPLTGWIHDSAWKGGASHPMTLFWGLPWFRIGAIANLDPVTKETVHTLFWNVHTALNYALYVLLAAHTGAVVKHQVFDKEKELQRMWL
jgi:cytochrome b561